MEIVEIKISDIKPYKNNAKKHPKKQVKRIAASIEEFGMNDPIGVWGDDNLIIEGHGRLEAMKMLGYETVPVIRLDHLTEEQRKAYTLAHNKVAESEWDFELLDAEMEEIFSIDMEEFGFEFIDEEKNKETTQKRVENILNLANATFEGAGYFDIPQLEPTHESEVDDIIEWIGFNYVLTDKNPEGKAVHFFIDDYQFERIWKHPEKYVEKLKQYSCVLTPDFSPFADMPMATQIFNHYRKHWIGCFLQQCGVKVVPTIRASRDERSLEWYLDGEPEGGVVAISSMWTQDEQAKAYFLIEFEMMMQKLKPEKVFVYGREVEELEEYDVEIEYIPTFARKRFGNG